MSKELEALKELKNNLQWLQENTNFGSYFTNNELHFKFDFDIIETALKKLEQLQVIIGAEKIEDLPQLALETENDWYRARYRLKEAEKKHKALEIIKKYPKCSLAHLITYECAKRKGYSVGSLDINDIPYTQEEYDIVIQELEELVEERLKRF